MDGGDGETLYYTEDAIKTVADEVLDEAVYRILWAAIDTGAFDAARN